MGKMVCPRCGSVNVIASTSFMTGLGVPVSYECLDCGFESVFMPEVSEEKIDDFREHVKKHETTKKRRVKRVTYSSSTAYGKFLVKYWVLLIPPLAALILLITALLYVLLSALV